MTEHIKRFVSELETIMPEGWQGTTFTVGKKYARIVSRGSAWGFVDLATGDLFRPKNWSGPAKHARGNVKDPDLIKKVEWTGPTYLR